MIPLERIPTMDEVVVTGDHHMPHNSSKPKYISKRKPLTQGTSSRMDVHFLTDCMGLMPYLRGRWMELQSQWRHVAISSGPGTELLVLSPHIYETKGLWQLPKAVIWMCLLTFSWKRVLKNWETVATSESWHQKFPTRNLVWKGVISTL